MQLYGSYTSPFVRHCRIALLETGLDCEFIQADASVSATKSPTQKLPFLLDGELALTDSAAILRYIREKSGQAFLPDITTYDHFLLASTALDAWVVLFMLEKDGLTVESSAYLQRQRRRIDTCLAALEPLEWPAQPPYNDLHLRLGCMMDWCLFRKRMTFESYPRLSAFLASMRSYAPFADTEPREA